MSRRAADLERLSVDELLSEGIAAARIDDKSEAKRLLVEVTERDPERPEAWLWLASVEGNPRAKRDHFQRVLALRPGDSEARTGLDRLVERYGSSILEEETEAATLYCTWHPDRETLLTCSRCGRPMCTSCAVRHPVGMRCKECARELRSPIYAVGSRDLLAGFAASLVGAVAAGTLLALASGLGFFLWILAFAGGSAAGTAIADAASRFGGRKRGRPMTIAVVAALVMGIWLPHLGLSALNGPGAGAGQLVSLSLVRAANLASAFYLLAASGAAAARLR